MHDNFLTLSFPVLGFALLLLEKSISGNQYLCNGTSCQKKSSNSGTKKWLAGVLGGIIPPLVVAAVLGGFRSWRNRRKEKANVDTSNSAAAEEGGSSAPGKCWNWRKKLNSKPSGGGAGKPGKPKPSGLQSGTDDPKLGTRVTKIISKESVAPTTSLVENMLGVQQTTVDQNDYTTAET
ncbi:hypothetical protein RJ641_032976 [Dillenia turbinata]|uniref:Uncharacterized protein n=1 Tax=Dillenia turbinata TaxID=194707 RepID=A0AAN8VTR7_9MAGN